MTDSVMAALYNSIKVVKRRAKGGAVGNGMKRGGTGWQRGRIARNGRSSADLGRLCLLCCVWALACLVKRMKLL